MTEPMSEATAVALATDPFMLRFIANANRQGGHIAPITTPRDVIGEQRLAALGMLQGRFKATKPDDPWLARRLGAALIYEAVPFLWPTKITQVAFAYTLPRHITGNWELPHELMWWTFESSLRSYDERTGDDVDHYAVDALLLQVADNGLNVLTLRAIGGEEPTAQKTVIPSGMRYPEEVPGALRQLLSLLAFVKSPYVSKDRQYTHKPTDKVKFHGRRIGDPVAIQVVKLRSSIHEAVAVERGEGPQWKQRWLVRGHYRAQWYASTGTHKVIWIAPYIKGPDGAELKTPVYAVVR